MYHEEYTGNLVLYDTLLYHPFCGVVVRKIIRMSKTSSPETFRFPSRIDEMVQTSESILLSYRPSLRLSYRHSLISGSDLVDFDLLGQGSTEEEVIM